MPEKFREGGHIPTEGGGYARKWAIQEEGSAFEEAGKINAAAEAAAKQADAKRPPWKRALGIGRNEFPKKTKMDVLEGRAHKDNAEVDAARVRLAEEQTAMKAAWEAAAEKVWKVHAALMATPPADAAIGEAFDRARAEFRAAEDASFAGLGSMSGDDLIGAGYVGPAEFRRTIEEAAADLAGEQELTEGEWGSLLLNLEHDSQFGADFIRRNWHTLGLDHHQKAREYFFKHMY